MEEDTIMQPPDTVKGRISVVMPVYNASKTVAASAGSVLNQTYADLELILVDDGSQDGSLDICRTIQESDPRVLLITQENGGPARARNAAMEIMTGEFVTFADSDDLLTPDACRLMAEAMGDRDLVIGHYFFDLGKVSTKRGLLDGSRALTEEEFLKELMQYPGSFYFSALWNKLYRTELIRKAQLTFDPFFDWGEDFAFNMRYYHGVENGVYLLDAPVYHYVKNPVGTSVRSLIHVAHSCRIKWRLYQHFKGLYQEKGLYEANKRLIDRYIYNVTLAD